MRIAHGAFLWQDGRVALEACLRSTVPHVDEVILADGLIDGVPDLGLPWHSDLAWLADPSDFLPDHMAISSKSSLPGERPWPTLSAACNWLLGKARALDCDWLLIVDADQELHNGDALRAWLDSYDGDALPITRQEKNVRMLVPWQCIRVAAFTRYIAGTYILEHADGRTVNLVPDEGTAQHYLPSAPWISHHPERRPPWRRAQRLGQYETVLEPPPPAVALQARSLVLESPSMDEAAKPVASAPAYYCPGCGSRYFAPGVCANGHPSQEVLLDPDMGVAPDEPVVDAGASEERAAGAETTAAVTDAPAASPTADALVLKAAEHVHAAIDLLAQAKSLG